MPMIYLIEGEQSLSLPHIRIYQRVTSSSGLSNLAFFQCIAVKHKYINHLQFSKNWEFVSALDHT